jgi:hypothetical protein
MLRLLLGEESGEGDNVGVHLFHLNAAVTVRRHGECWIGESVFVREMEGNWEDARGRFSLKPDLGFARVMIKGRAVAFVATLFYLGSCAMASGVT